MKSYLFLVSVLADNLRDIRTFEQYVSADTRVEAIASLAIRMANQNMRLLGITAIATKQTPFSCP